MFTRGLIHFHLLVFGLVVLEQITSYSLAHQRFAVTSHARPDGDSIGSQLGLALALESLGKAVDIVNADPPPHAYSALPGVERIRVSESLEGVFDAVFVLECNNLERPGVGNLSRYYVINIDHHAKTESFGQLNWVDPSAAAVAEMVYTLLGALKAPVTAAIATNLYAAILTDTGSFQFANTRAETFAIVGDLVARGADPAWVARQVYMNQPRSKLDLLVKVLETLEIHPSGGIASIFLTPRVLEQVQASPGETEGLINYALGIEGVELAAFFREEHQDLYRISLRSKSDLDVGEIARYFGGGGHKNAAGFSLEGSLNQVREKVLSQLEDLFAPDKS